MNIHVRICEWALKLVTINLNVELMRTHRILLENYTQIIVTFCAFVYMLNVHPQCKYIMLRFLNQVTINP